MLSLRAQNNHTHPIIFVEPFEDAAQLVALTHGNDIERRAVEDNVGALPRRIDFDAKAVERFTW